MAKPKPQQYRAHYRVYYEDTDAGGVMYHASYLRFAERARTELLRHLGYNQRHLTKTDGIFFVVRAIEAEYLKPAFLDDMLHVESCVGKMSRTSMVMEQDFFRGEELICKVKVVIICVSSKMKPTAIPKNLQEKLMAHPCAPARKAS
jgi:acyl-CoA thioester hydrolase